MQKHIVTLKNVYTYVVVYMKSSTNHPEMEHVDEVEFKLMSKLEIKVELMQNILSTYLFRIALKVCDCF